jgi:arylsulfatase A-like enzyme
VANEERFTIEAWDESSAKAGWWKRKKGQPFFSIFNFMDAHQSRTMTHHYDWYEEHVIGQIPQESRIGVDELPMPPFYRDSKEMRTQMGRVYNSLKLTDNKIGTLLKQLDADGLMDSTIIFLYGDHGQGIPRGKTNGIGLGYRIPFVIWFPKMYRHLSPWGTSVVSDELISFEDLAPTMISLAGGKIPDHMKGRVLLGPERDAPTTRLFLSSDRSDNGIDMVRTVTNGRYLYSRNYMPFMPEVRYIRYMEIGEIKQIMRNDLAAGKLNDVQRSIFEDRPAEVLYDLTKDPWELHNLVDDPALGPLLNEMRAALDNNVLNSRDVMFLPEYEISRIAATATPYEFRQNDAQYPLNEIYQAASLSGLRADDIAAKQIAMLRHQNRVVRYWAGVGLRSQEDSVLKRYREILLKAMKDDYPPVSITASSICYDVFGDDKALEQLVMHSQNSDPHLALLTINYLLYVRRPDPFAPTIKNLLARKGLTYNVSAAAKDFLGRLGLIPNDFENR